jgi:hypothetical protein
MITGVESAQSENSEFLAEGPEFSGEIVPFVASPPEYRSDSENGEENQEVSFPRVDIEKFLSTDFSAPGAKFPQEFFTGNFLMGEAEAGTAAKNILFLPASEGGGMSCIGSPPSHSNASGPPKSDIRWGGG